MAIKLPINVLTPPIRVLQTDGEPEKSAAPQNAAPQSTGKRRGSGSQKTFESIFAQMLKHYLPETVTFTPLDESVLRETIGNWLRPAYEQAIRARQERTQRQNAELDADAWSRGIGASSYVTDVKERAFRSEAQDISDLESDYAATLAGHLYDAMRAQQEQKIAVDQFNAEQINHAREKAAQAAQSLYNSYRSSGGRGTGAGTTESTQPEQSTSYLDRILSAAAASAADTGASVDYQTAANLVSRMSKSERAQLYAGTGAPYAQQYSEILRGIGQSGLNRLKAQFPA